jgi:hypothetical protein
MIRLVGMETKWNDDVLVSSLEVLNRAFMFFRGLARRERTQVPPLASLGIRFSRIQPVLPVF